MILGSDCSREEWQHGLARALELAPTHLHVLQAFKKPRRARHRVYRPAVADVGGVTPPRETHAPTMTAVEVDGRLRLCPYYFVVAGQPRLSGALATFCPPDKKIIHGMTDAALLPCRAVNPPVGS